MATTTPPELEAGPFAAWKYEDAVAAITTALEARLGKAGFAATKAFVEANDHWQSGDTWVGPDGGGSAELRTKVLQAVSRQFTPVNMIGEVLENFANGLLKREADVQVVPVEPGGQDGEPSEAQATACEQLLTQLSQWWDARQLWHLTRMAARRARWAEHGPLRCWITPDTLVTTGDAEDAVTALPTGLPFEEALAKVQLMAPEPDVALVYVDPDTQQRAALFRTHETIEGKETGVVEVWTIEDEVTVVRVLRESDGEGAASEVYRVDLGGRLPIAQVEGSALITEPVRRQQNRLNFFESLLTRVGETAGFPERYTLNAEPHGVWLSSPPSDGPALKTAEVGGQTWYLHRAVRTIGAAITTDLRGVTSTVVDAGGAVRETVLTPGVEFKEPTDPAYAIRACEHARATILRECRQGHLATTATAESSGDAYEQARAAFENDLETHKGSLETAIRQVLEAAIAYAEAMSGPAEGGSRLEQFRIIVTCHVHAGPVSSEHRRVVLELYQANVITRATALAMIGVEDTAAELAALDQDPIARLTLLTKQAEAVRAWVDAGAPLDIAAEIVGLPPDMAKKLVDAGRVDPVVEQ